MHSHPETNSYAKLIFDQVKLHAENKQEYDEAIGNLEKIDLNSNSPRQLFEEIEAFNRLSTQLMYTNNQGSYVVGILGEWGIGKTALLKAIESEAQRRLKDKDQDIVIVPIFFNPWRYEHEAHIVLPMFEQFYQSVEAYRKNKNLTDKAKEKLKYASIYLKYLLLSSYKMLKPKEAFKAIKAYYSGDLADLSIAIDPNGSLSDAGNKAQEETLQGVTIEEIYDKLNVVSIYHNIPNLVRVLGTFHKVHFLFLVDDLDRLLPHKALKVIEHIKTLLDIDNVTTILAMDDKVIAHAVNLHYKEYNDNNEQIMVSGAEYLERIINLPIHLSRLNDDTVERLINDVLPQIIKLTNKVDYKIDNDDEAENMNSFKELIKKCIKLYGYYIPRKVIRLLSLFEFNLRIVAEIKLFSQELSINEKDFHFIFKITALNLFFPELYHYLKEDQELYDFLCCIYKNGEKYDIDSLEAQCNINDKSKYSFQLEAIKKHLMQRNPLPLHNIFKNKYDGLLYTQLFNLSAQLSSLTNSLSGEQGSDNPAQNQPPGKEMINRSKPSF